MIALDQTAFAVAPRISASFLATGGVEPYTYSVLAANSAGGSIDMVSGKYTAPSIWNQDPKYAFDTIEAEDANGDKATAKIQIGSPLKLFMEIIQREMGLSDDRIYLFGQKKDQPSNTGVYVVISHVSDKVFGNTNRFNPATDKSEQYLSVAATLGVDIFSVDTSALWRKGEILLALGSDYSERQQNMNSFQIARLPKGMQVVALPNIDGTHIPYRFHCDVVLQYADVKSKATEYFDTFDETEVTINP